MNKLEGRAHIYCRVSSAGQEDGYSLDTQEEACRKWAVERGLVVASVAREIWSGHVRHRPQLDAVRDNIESGDTFLCYALDRLSRNQDDTPILIALIEDRGARVAFVTEDFEQSAIGKFMRNAKSFGAEFQLEKIRENTQRGKKARIASGRPLAGYKAPYGYKWADPEKKRGSKSHLILDPETAPTVRLIFDLALAGGSLRAIAARLSEKGIPSPTGLPRWSPAAVRYVLRRTTYSGTHTIYRMRCERLADGRYRDRESTPEEQIALTGIAPAIVTSAEQEAVLARLDHNRNASPRNNTRPELTLLRAGHIRCGHCGYVLGVRNPTPCRPNSSPTYLCVHQDCRQRGVTQPSISASVIDPIAWRLVCDFLRDPEQIAREVEHYRQDGGLDRDHASIDRQLSGIADRQRRLSRAVAALDDDEAAAPLLAELKTLADQKRAAEAERRDLDRRIAHAEAERSRIKGLADWAARVNANLDTLDYEGRRDALTALGVLTRIWRPNATDDHGDALPRWEITLQPLGSENEFVFSSTRGTDRKFAPMFTLTFRSSDVVEPVALAAD